MDSTTQAVTVPQADVWLASRTMRRVAWRLIPFLLLLYICNLIDRGNVAFAKLTMQPDLGMSDTAYAFGSSGMFYFGYLLFEVPSNLILRRTGARVWIARIMISWGLVTCATLLVKGAASFFTVRGLLGVAEAGFFPGIILYLTYWFPARERTRAVAWFMAANAVAGIITNPLSGAIVHYLDKVGGLHGWQWIFLLEGLPSVVLGVVVFFFLTDRPAQAAWLNPAERQWLAERMSSEDSYRQKRHGADFLRAMTDPRVWFLILLYFTVAFSSNAGGLYLPELVKNHFQNGNSLQIGLLSALPSVCGLIGMLFNGAWADRTGKHRLHVAAPAFLAALGWAVAASSRSPWIGLGSFCLAVMGMMSMLPPYWSLPTSFLSGAAAAGGIALINSVANIGGAVGPTTLGMIRDRTGNLTYGLVALAFVMFLGGVLALFAPHDPTLSRRVVPAGGEPETSAA